jgi:hypothetical protein
MNFELIGNLIRLRYKLMWARMRTRNGKIALFVAGYLALALFGLLMAGGGVSAGVAAIRSGQGELIAGVVLTAVYFQALISTVLLGFGINAVFTETELRRYPVTARERFVARHCIGILDPFWFLVLVIDFGLLIGMYVFGNASLGLGALGILLLFVSNYMLARALALAMERLTKGKTGSLVVMAGISCFGFLGALIPTLEKHKDWADRLLNVLRLTPGFAAAGMVAGSTTTALYGLGLLVWWGLGFAAILRWLERAPAPRKREAETSTIAWESGFERLGALFGPRNGPLVGHWLRFYVRNNRFRTLALITLPMMVFLTYNFGRNRHEHAQALFAAAVGTFPITSFLCTSRIAVNYFGYTDGGCRRLFLLPIRPGDTLRTASYASLLLGGGMLVLGTVLWLAAAPVPKNGIGLLMLVASGLAGLFGFHAAGLWSSIYGPRRGKYDKGFGNDMSLAGNIVFIGGMVSALIVPQILLSTAPWAVSPAGWWIAVAAAALALVFYRVSLRLVGEHVERHREHLMAVVEGRV